MNSSSRRKRLHQLLDFVPRTAGGLAYSLSKDLGREVLPREVEKELRRLVWKKRAIPARFKTVRVGVWSTIVQFPVAWIVGPEGVDRWEEKKRLEDRRSEMTLRLLEAGLKAEEVRRGAK